MTSHSNTFLGNTFEPIHTHKTPISNLPINRDIRLTFSIITIKASWGNARILHLTVIVARFSSMIRANRAECSPSARRFAKFTCPTVVLHDNTGLDRSAWISCFEHRFLRLVTYQYFQTIISRRRKIYERWQCSEKWSFLLFQQFCRTISGVLVNFRIAFNIERRI